MYSRLVKQFIGTKVYHFEEIDSTNDYAAYLLSKTTPTEGTVVNTSYQSAGKGQFGRKWHVQRDKNITLSVILYPQIVAIDQFLLNIMASLAVRDTIAQYTRLPIEVKWPNDVYYQNHKLSGILIKNFIAGQNIGQTIMGIGINTNQESFPELPTHPSSIRQLSGQYYDLTVVKKTLYTQLELYYHMLRHEPDRLRSMYKDHLLGMNTHRQFLIDDHVYSGSIVDIDLYGQLVVQFSDEKKHFSMGEIKMIMD